MVYTTLALINAVAKRGSLWDVSSKSFKDNRINRNAWIEVCAELGVPEQDQAIIRRKWKNLKDYYRSEMKRVNQANEYKKSLWPYYEKMSFIKKTVGYRKQASEMESENLSNHSDGVVVECDDMLLSRIKVEPSDSFGEIYPEHELSENGFEATEEVDEDSKIELRRQNTGLCEAQIDEGTADEDGDEYFFKSLLPHMRPLPVLEKLQLRMEMQRLVYEAVTRNTS